jgi:hypothetical protein
MRKCLLLLAVPILVLPLVLGPARAQDDKDFVPLFNGKDFTGLKFAPSSIDPTKTWSVKDGTIVCTGKPNGYFYTEKSYKNYILRAEFKYPDKAGNSGYLIHIQGEHKVWPKCIEVQGQYSGVCSIFPISGLKGPKADNAEARKKAAKPHTEWNTVEIVSKDGTLTSSLNGTKIAEAGPYDAVEGPIGFQSEGAEIHFRNIRIKELK